MTKFKIISALAARLKQVEAEQKISQQKLFENFNNNFAWQAETLWMRNYELGLLRTWLHHFSVNNTTEQEIIEAMREVKADFTRSILESNFTNKSTSALANIEKDCERQVQAKFVKLLQSLVK